MARVRLFVTCMVDAFRPDVGRAAVAVLEQQGDEVDCPLGQTCCGQFAYNAGYRREAAQLARHFVEIFEQDSSPIVALSGSCAAMVIHHYPALLRETAIEERGAVLEAEGWAERARAVGSRVREFSQWLGGRASAESPTAGVRGRVALHQGCHMRRILKEEQQPKALLEEAGYEVVELPDSDQCCGFGGTYSMTEWRVSTALADAKIAAFRRAEAEGASALVSADLGCLLHLGGRFRRLGAPDPTRHVAEILAADAKEAGG
ncbi:MAG: (Fe-S)-binding protein [Firmicutes bacterium]|nr:(Fe-S)-binding protein [Bacillota bacterium]